jgi:hypothetical protein
MVEHERGPIEKEIFDSMEDAFAQIGIWRERVLPGMAGRERAQIPLDAFASDMFETTDVLFNAILRLAAEIDRLRHQQVPPA